MENASRYCVLPSTGYGRVVSAAAADATTRLCSQVEYLPSLEEIRASLLISKRTKPQSTDACACSVDIAKTALVLFDKVFDCIEYACIVVRHQLIFWATTPTIGATQGGRRCSAPVNEIIGTTSANNNDVVKEQYE